MAQPPTIPLYFIDDAGCLVPTDRRDLGDVLRRADVEAVFQPGVVYMPVPRCDSCRHWHRIGEGASVGNCVELMGDSLPEDFGCVLHTPREATDA